MADSLRKVVGDNLERLMKASPTLSSTLAIERASEAQSAKIGKSTIDRILHGTTPVNLDYIEALALVFALEPWELLWPNLDPKNRPPSPGIGSAQLQMLEDLAGLAHRIVELDDRSSKTETDKPSRKAARS